MSKKNISHMTAEEVCHKNDILELEITGMGNEGEGIGRINGYTLFVKDAMAGDVVRVKVIKAKKHYGYGRLLEIITPSANRVTPPCPTARQCGGCQLQHCSYESQIQWKEEKIRECLNRIGKFNIQKAGQTAEEDGQQANVLKAGQTAEEDGQQANVLKTGQTAGEGGQQIPLETPPVIMEPLLAMDKPEHYRNKAQFPVGISRDGNPVAGFYAGRTHNIIANTDCMIQHPCTAPIVETVLAFLQDFSIPPYDEKEHAGLVRHILIRVGVFTGQIMVCLVINGNALPHSESLVRRLLDCHLDGCSAKGQKLRISSICLNKNTEKTNVILGSKISCLYGKPYIEDNIGAIKYRISPLSFYQVNPIQTAKLYETALSFADLKGGEIVWDLYCGIGTISLFLAQKAEKVCGVEIVPQAVEDARKNAEINKIENVTFFAGAAETVVPEQYEKSGGSLKADVVVLDPPRKGCNEKLLNTVVRMNPERIVYVSCDPATLARDLRYLCDNGYMLKRVRGCDMFGMSYHVETVCVLHLTDS